MTTIAASVSEGVMCSDTFWSDGDECGPMKKIHRIRGDLLGVAGDLSSISKWLEAYRKNKPLRGDCLALRLSRSGLSTWTVQDGWVATGKQHAIGTGGKAARGALAAGASCRRAVRIACDIDARSGGPISQFTLR